LQVSRLDTTERNFRLYRATKKAASSSYEDDIDTVELAEERRREALLLVSSGPALKADLSNEKLCFVRQFGLTTSITADGELCSNYTVYK